MLAAMPGHGERGATQRHVERWRRRVADWQRTQFDTRNHPHRDLVLRALDRLEFASLLEVGCGAGANLSRIPDIRPDALLLGVDVSIGALRSARRLLPAATVRLLAGRADALPLGDGSVDVALTDMTLIYVGPERIHDAIAELSRVTRGAVVFCEFHHPRLLRRIHLGLHRGYHAYDYPRLLGRHGFARVELEKIPEGAWPGGEPQRTFACLVTARR
jgi:ubiquinone/menaquinone biosynthesis C-methylase UbiE